MKNKQARAKSTFTEVFTEAYDVRLGLSEKDQIKYWLILKYERKVSKRLLDHKKYLRRLCDGATKAYLATALSNPNPFLSLIKSEKTWGGAYAPIPNFESS